MSRTRGGVKLTTWHVRPAITLAAIVLSTVLARGGRFQGVGTGPVGPRNDPGLDGLSMEDPVAALVRNFYQRTAHE